MQAPSAGGAAISTSYRRAPGRSAAIKRAPALPTSIPTLDEIHESTAALECAFPAAPDPMKLDAARDALAQAEKPKRRGRPISASPKSKRTKYQRDLMRKKRAGQAKKESSE